MHPLEEQKEYSKLLRRAHKQNWRLDVTDAMKLAAMAANVGHINREDVGGLARRLQYGEVYVRKDGHWACTTCGGNCGQCGNTGFLGNIGFSFDRVVAMSVTEHSGPSRMIEMEGTHVTPGIWVNSVIVIGILLLTITFSASCIAVAYYLIGGK